MLSTICYQPTKKKLDDVRRKLDALYEKLGNGAVS